MHATSQSTREMPLAPPLDHIATSPASHARAQDTLGDRVRLVALVGITLVFVGLTFLLAIPFLPAITWSIALAVIAWPLHRKLEIWIQRPALAAAISTTVVVAILGGIGGFVAYQLAKEGAAAAEKAHNVAETGVRSAIERVPGLAPMFNWMDRVGVDVETEVRKFIASFTQDFSGLAQGSAVSVVQFLAAIFLLFFLLRDRGPCLAAVRSYLPLSRREADRVLTRAADSVHANLYATFVTSVIDGVGIGLMFWWLGLPAPILWSLVMFILSLLPVVGAGLVWLPAAGYLAVNDRVGAGMLLIGWSLLFFVLSDNLLYARLVGPRMQVHPAVALLAFFGGLAVFGVSGMVIGPAILAVTIAFAEVWRYRLTGESAVAILDPTDPDALR